MILYVDAKDGKPVYMLIGPFGGVLITKRPRLHMRLMVCLMLAVAGAATALAIMTGGAA